MKKIIPLSVFLLLFLVGCQAPTEPTQTDDVEETSSVKHYSDDLLSFDYPGDLVIFGVTHGEGSFGEELTFLELDEDGIYRYAGPVIAISSWGQNQAAGEQYDHDRQENETYSPKNIGLSGAEAFEWTVPDDFGGQPYTGLEFKFKGPEYVYDAPERLIDYYGVISRPLGASGERYEEIVKMFKDSVAF